ncbi:DUF1905 domain-containing protein [Pontibacter qinzhouensis]|uniref:DUF1905 domain-containing protein n=1 Tax=Pontibacter qinzhouensis TaxID=2603253 RepID=A0A5C8K9P7_9BACT|nr:YdeI/OmpD-associated family protein [Pontibacter qinzhouensis]TXK51339.1 DUF1905 domain-containing protein [Pontibacter qinzhouensis]
MQEPLTDKAYQLEKFSGKGGWTYIAFPEITQDKKAYFGLVKVNGTLDAYELKSASLMPMGNGKVFLPVKAEIRKKIGKEAGDWVHVTLYAENSPEKVREELLLCLQDEPAAYQTFVNYAQAEQQACVDWIFAAKTDDMKVARIVQTIDRLLYAKGRTLADKKHLST